MRGTRDLFLIRRLHTGSEAHPKATGGYFPDGKGDALKANHLHTSSDEDKNSGARPLLPYTSSRFGPSKTNLPLHADGRIILNAFYTNSM